MPPVSRREPLLDGIVSRQEAVGAGEEGEGTIGLGAKLDGDADLSGVHLS